MSDTKTAEKPQPPTALQRAPITKVKTLQELWDHPGLKKRMGDLMHKPLSVDRLLRTLMNAVLKTPGLAKVHPMSMLGVSMTLAYLDLEPNTPLQQVHIIPFDVTKWNPASRQREYVRTDANLIIGYQGYIELIARAEKVKDIDCQLIWPGDTWEHERGSNMHFRHIPKYQAHAETDEPDFAYMHARLMNGGEYTEVMTKAEVHLIRSRSQGFRAAMYALEDAQKKSRKPSAAYTEAPWIKWPQPMFRKTPLRAGQKWLPKSAELAVAIDMDEASEQGRVRFDQILDAEAVSEGAWAVPSDQVDPDEELEATDTKDKPEPTKTTTSGKAAPKTDAKTDPKPTPAKTAKDEPPPGRFADDEGQGTQTASGAATGQGDAAGSDAAAETGQASDAQAGEAGAGDFDEWLLDMNGEPIGEETHTNPIAFAQALEQQWQNPVGREAILEQNKDAMEKASADPKAKAIIDSLAEPNEEEETDPTDLVVDIPAASGRENLPQYLKDFKAATLKLTQANYLDFLAANTPNMTKVAASTRNLLVKAMAEAADRLQIERPADLATILAGPIKDAAADLARDERAADMRIAELKDCKDPHAMQGWREGTVLKSFTARLDREGKRSILDRLNAAWEEQKKAIKG